MNSRKINVYPKEREREGRGRVGGVNVIECEEVGGSYDV